MEVGIVLDYIVFLKLLGSCIFFIKGEILWELVNKDLKFLRDFLVSINGDVGCFELEKVDIFI